MHWDSWQLLGDGYSIVTGLGHLGAGSSKVGVAKFADV